MTALSRDFRRVLAVSLLLAVAMLAHAFVIEPVLKAHRRLDTAWAENAVLLNNYRRIAGELGSLAEAQSTMENDSSIARAYLTTPSLALAATELQSRLNATIARHKAQLIGTRVLEPVEDGAFQLVVMRVTLSAGLASLQSVLYELESAVPLLFIDELAIQRQETRVLARAAPPALPAADPRLDVSFNLLAYLRRNGS